MVRGAELVNQSLRSFGLLHDALLVVLPQGPGQLVVVHGRPVLALAPEGGHPVGVHDLEDAPLSVEPVDAARVHVGLVQEFLDELPEVDVGRGAAGGGGGGIGGAGSRGAAAVGAGVLVWKAKSKI